MQISSTWDTGGVITLQKLSGIHFYVCITNFNQVILDEEKQTGSVTHALHALDTFFTSIESFGKKLSKRFIVEKITGSRLHLYIVDEIIPAYEIVATVSEFAYKLAKYFRTDISKYKTLKPFSINVGVAYGKFYDFEFTSMEGFSETTTIGYAANFAAKLQALSSENMISISESIFEVLASDEKKKYKEVADDTIKKYDQNKYYTSPLINLASALPISEENLTGVKEYANRTNLSDIDFSGVRSPLNFNNLTKTQCKKLDGIPVYADVRDFTCQFEEDDSNLDEMAQKTQQILEAMYRICTMHGGIHVQFQGDRELSLYHNVPQHSIDGKTVPEKKCFKSAVLAAMRMIDAVKPYSVHIGVGEDFGRLFATKIGARGEKDNILLGETVIQADIMEDKYAGEDQIAITSEVYTGLRREDSFLAQKFVNSGICYIATMGYSEYMRHVSYQQQSRNTSQNNYNGAWGELN